MSLKVENLVKHYKIAGTWRYILNGINLDVNGGELISITGHSGCGKTTLFNVISGLTAPNNGKVYINEKRLIYVFDFIPARKRNKEIGFIFQTFRLLSEETVKFNTLLPARINGKINKETHEFLDDILNKLRIYKYKNTKVGLLSGGQKQRVSIARALINDPSIILADEPTANLDKKTSFEIFDILSELKENGKAIVVITHKDYMHKLSDRLYVMERGLLREM